MQTKVLEEDFDASYEPTRDEIMEYAQFIGIQEDEPDLMWIAREGLKAPLPQDWKPCQSEDGDVYYFNFKTGESIWNHPCDDFYIGKVEEERKKLHSKLNQSKETQPKTQAKDSKKELPQVQVYDADATLAFPQKIKPLKAKNALKVDSQEDIVTSIINLAAQARQTSTEDDSQKDVVQKLLQDKIEALKKQLADKESEERNLNEQRLQVFRQQLAEELVNAEINERHRAEQQLNETRKQLIDQLALDSTKVKSQYEVQLQQQRQALQNQFEQDKIRVEAEYKEKLKVQTAQIEEQYRKELSEGEFKARFERKKKQFEVDADKEMEKLKHQANEKKLALLSSLEEVEDLEKRKFELKMEDLRKAQRKEEELELQKQEKTLASVRNRLQDKIKSTERELESQEANLRGQLSSAHQQQLQDREQDFERRYAQMEDDWNEKLSKLKRSLQFEQNALEEKLVMVRSHSLKDSGSTMAAALLMKKNEVAELIKQNDGELARQKQKQEELQKLAGQLLAQKNELKQRQLVIDQQKVQTKVKAPRSPRKQQQQPFDEDQLSISDLTESDEEESASPMVQELNRRLRTEEDQIQESKRQIKQQRAEMAQQTSMVEQTRQQWRAEMEEIQTQMDKVVPVAKPQHSTPVADQDLSSVVTQLRTQNFSSSQGSRYMPQYQPNHSKLPVDILKWDQDRKRSESMLRQHSEWLQQFRQKIGMQRTL